jgi:signal transduction histidine kinase
MTIRKSLFGVMPDQPVPLAGALAVLLALVQSVFDWATPISLDISAVYSLPLVMAALARSRRLVWWLALGLVTMTFAVYVVQIDGAVFVGAHFMNRVLSAVTIVLTAGMAHAWIVAVKSLSVQSRAMKEQNEELERLRRAAEVANGRKSQILASVAHDIRTPLHIIDMTANLMRRADVAPAQISILAERLLRNARALADLVSALVDISSLDAGQSPLQNSAFSLTGLLAEECDRLTPLAHAKGLRLSCELPERPISLQTDRIKMARVLSNLIGNAIKFTETGGITLRAALASDGAVLIQVKDTGVGMSTESVGRIFDEYGQLGNPERDSSKGWGLGLAICRRLVGVMGGTIDVESIVNEGTVFTIRLPASRVIDIDSGMTNTT